MFTTEHHPDFAIVTFELDGGIIGPEQLPEALSSTPEVDATKGVIISGRGPVWLFACLCHHYHATRWVACFEPRRAGGVVVQSHDRTVAIGSIVPV